jgi:hypothetical protein
MRLLELVNGRLDLCHAGLCLEHLGIPTVDLRSGFPLIPVDQHRSGHEEHHGDHHRRQAQRKVDLPIGDLGQENL